MNPEAQRIIDTFVAQRNVSAEVAKRLPELLSSIARRDQRPVEFTLRLMLVDFPDFGEKLVSIAETVIAKHKPKDGS